MRVGHVGTGVSSPPRFANRPARSAGNDRPLVVGAALRHCDVIRRGVVLAALAIGLAMGCVTDAFGQAPAAEVGGFTRFGSYPTFLPFERLDPQHLGLTVWFTDLVLPANHGRQLRVERALGYRGWLWGVSGIPTEVVDGTYSGYPVVTGDQVNQVLLTYGPWFVTSDGGRRQMYYEQFPNPSPTPDPATGLDPSYRYAVAPDHTRYDVVTRTLYLPDGTWCEFQAPGLNGSHLVSLCGDAFGPFLTVTYGPGASRTYRQILDGPVDNPTQYRDLLFEETWNAGAVTMTLQAVGRTWTATAASDGYATFTEPGLSTPWTFAFQHYTSGSYPFEATPWNPNPVLEVNLLSTVTLPAGGTIQYTYQEPLESEHLPELPDTFLWSRGWFLATRQTSGPDVETGTWTFSGLQFDLDFVFAPAGFLMTPPPAGGTAAPVAYTNQQTNGVDAMGVPFLGADVVTVGQQTATRATVTGFAAQTFLQYVSSPVGTVTFNTLIPNVTTDYVCNPGGACTYYQQELADFDDFQHVTRLVERSNLTPDERVTQTSYRNRTTIGEPYILGLPLETTVAVNGDSIVTTRDYDAVTSFLTDVTAAGVRTHFEPDLHGNVARQTVAYETPLAHQTDFTYDWGVVASQATAAVTTQRTINADGSVASATTGYGSAHARTTIFTYDAAGRPETVTPPDGLVAITAYDTTAGHWVMTTRGTARDETVLDSFGRPVLTRSGTTASALAEQQTSYYADGRVHGVGVPSSPGTSTPPMMTYAYDDALRVVTTTLPDGATSTSTVSVEVGEDTTWVQQTLVDENGRTTRLRHQGLAVPTETPVTTVIDAANQSWQYIYDALTGALTDVQAPDAVTRGWAYAAGTKRLLSETHPESGQTQYLAYWEDGALKQMQDARDTTVDYTYDAAGRLETVSAHLSGEATEVTTYTYEDGSNQIATVTGLAVATAYVYDEAGRLHTRTDTIDGTAFTVAYDYDTSDHLAQITYPSGRIVRYGYDGANRLVAVCRDVMPCSESTPLEHTYATAFAYDVSGALASYQARNGLVTTLTYDAERQRLSTLAVGDGATALALTYEYDPVGNITRILDGTRTAWSQTFCYDTLDRLTLAVADAYGSRGYTYDAHGNRLTGGNNTGSLESPVCETPVSGAATFTYDPANRFRLTQIAGGPVLGYDAGGNLTTAPGVSYAYTAQNQLRTATPSGGAATQYTYDATQWRVKKAVPGQPVVYAIRGPDGQLLSEWTNSSPNATVRDSIYAGGRLLGVMTTHQQAR